MFNVKSISFVIVISSLLLSGCTNNKTESVNSDLKSKPRIAQTNYSYPISIGSKKLLVEVVNTDTTRAQGLSYRTELVSGTGMLFDFTNSKSTRPNFWMKDMNFDIDIIWIANNKIIGITKNVPAPKNNFNLPTYSPPSDISHVLEVPSGWSDENKIQVGDLVNL